MLLGANLTNLLSARKDLPITPSIKMKQLQWDKLPQQQVSKTLWKDEKPDKEKEMLQKLQMDGVWMEMEEDFKAKQLVINLMGTDTVQSVITLFNCCFPSPTETRGTQECFGSTNKETCW
jgi:Flp pilus assembly protein CpaB